MLTKVRTENYHYYEDEQGNICGEYKSWYNNGQLREHCVFVNDNRHGEFKRWHVNGQLWVHCFYKHGDYHGEFKSWRNDGILEYQDFDCNGKDIAAEIVALVVDILNITDEEKLLIKLTFGIPCLPNK